MVWQRTKATRYLISAILLVLLIPRQTRGQLEIIFFRIDTSTLTQLYCAWKSDKSLQIVSLGWYKTNSVNLSKNKESWRERESERERKEALWSELTVVSSLEEKKCLKSSELNLYANAAIFYLAYEQSMTSYMCGYFRSSGEALLYGEVRAQRVRHTGWENVAENKGGINQRKKEQ